MTTYVPKLPNYHHQQKLFDESHKKTVYAIFWEQRTGKSKAVLDLAADAYERGSITGLLIVAPKGVDANWITDEIPKHLPDRIQRNVLVYRSDKSHTKKFQEQFKHLLTAPGLSILCTNYEACWTKRGFDAMSKFLKARVSLMVADESSMIGNPTSDRARATVKLGRLARARRILDGTPNTEHGPLELFSQFRFLDPAILGFTSFTAFKARYCILEPNYNRAANKHYNKIIGYAHIDELQAKIAPYTSRLLRADVLDMPDKIYQKHRYELSDEQRRVYNDLVSEFRSQLSGGQTISAAVVLTRYLRLQQILSNRLPASEIVLCKMCQGNGCFDCGEEGIIRKIPESQIVDPKHNPRLDALREELVLNHNQPTIVWCRFRSESVEIVGMCQALGRRPVVYDGTVSDSDRDAAKRSFQDGRADVFIGSPAAGGRGLTLSACGLVVYYSNYFSLRLRLQSEDRGEAPGKTQGTGIVDIIAENTIDEKIVSALRSKKALADFIQGDPSGVWI